MQGRRPKAKDKSTDGIYPAISQRILVVKNMPAMQETQVQSLGQEDPLEKDVNPLQCTCLENSMDRGA